MNKKEVVEYCLSLPNTFEDHPFKEDNISLVMKHSKNKKWFGLIMEVKGKIYLNVKTNPEYHMNKEHWNTIILGDNIDESIVKELIDQSYELTKK